MLGRWRVLHPSILCVSDAAPDAHRLYERVGFTTWGVELDAIRVAARSLNDHHMSLTL